jgi:hypothetical protein
VKNVFGHNKRGSNRMEKLDSEDNIKMDFRENVKLELKSYDSVQGPVPDSLKTVKYVS